MDRNVRRNRKLILIIRSLSARRAWIEIANSSSMLCNVEVALRKESVDRNYAANAVDQILPGVALRKESVDRNYF